MDKYTTELEIIIPHRTKFTFTHVMSNKKPTDDIVCWKINFGVLRFPISFMPLNKPAHIPKKEREKIYIYFCIIMIVFYLQNRL